MATLVMWFLAMFSGKIKETFKGFQDTSARNNILAGSVVGPCLGVWCSMVAVQLIPVGIASTIMATRPILMLPLSKIYYKENISMRAIVGDRDRSHWSFYNFPDWLISKTMRT